MSPSKLRMFNIEPPQAVPTEDPMATTQYNVKSDKSSVKSVHSAQIQAEDTPALVGTHELNSPADEVQFSNQNLRKTLNLSELSKISAKHSMQQ